MDKKIVWVLLALVSAAFATDINDAEYTGSVSSLEFTTDMQFTTDSTVTLVSGDIASGDPANLQSGDTICSNAVVRITPSVSAKWAAQDFSATALFPTCSQVPNSYCPPMLAYNTVNHNRDVKWFSSTIWDSHKAFGDNNDYSQTVSRYNELGASNFHNQRVSYDNNTGNIYANKEGGAGVFCKGTLQVVDNNVVKSTNSMPSASSYDLTLSTTGAHTVSTRLSNVDCFGAVVKHPLDLNNSGWFWLDYFTHGDPIAATIATDTITLNVDASGTAVPCDFHDIQVVSVNPSSQNPAATLVRIREHNDGTSPMSITSVTSPSGYIAFKAPEQGTLPCDWLLNNVGCVADNGFDNTIAAHATQDIYVLLIKNGNPTGSVCMTFTGESSGGTGCGGAGTCTDSTCIGADVATRCGIIPPSLSLGTNELAHFEVSCWNIHNASIPCQGDEWNWAGISGGFTERTNSYANAYTTAPPGTSGDMTYQSGLAMCYSYITTREPYFVCEFDPSSADLDANETQYFDFTCYLNGTETTPDDTEYDLGGGITGTLSNESTDGVTYNAPDQNTSGTLDGVGYLDISPYIIGAVDQALITVTSDSNGNQTNNTNCTDPNDPNCTSPCVGDCDGDDDGDTDACTIGSGPISVWPGYSGWVGIRCGQFANETCPALIWDIDGGSPGASDNNGTTYIVTGQPGSIVRITASYASDLTQTCWTSFFIGTPECWEFS
ncbi:MAG: hypothetical protein V1827_00065 [Candidatus Micrarchaeota archaeon]